MTQGRIHSLESFGTVDGPGTRYVVFVQGCPMRCMYCHNPDTWAMTGGTMMDPEYIFEQYKHNEPFYKNGGLTVTGGEPLMQVDFLIDLFTVFKRTTSIPVSTPPVSPSIRTTPNGWKSSTGCLS